MKTTIDIADATLAEAKRVAEEEGITLRALMDEGLRLALARREQASGFRLRDGSVGGRGLRPGIDLSDWDTIRDLIYEGHGA